MLASSNIDWFLEIKEFGSEKHFFPPVAFDLKIYLFKSLQVYEIK